MPFGGRIRTKNRNAIISKLVNHFEKFKCQIPKKYQIPKLRLTVDYIEDYNFINTIYKLTNKKVPSFEDIMSVIFKNKSLINFNKNMIQKKLHKLVLKKKFNKLLK